MILIVYILAIFSSAFLIFFIQPMFARMVLPMLGGTPAVWNVTQVFCEGSLLAGYLYAHLSTRWLDIRKQIITHMAIMIAAMFILPIRIPFGWIPPADRNPIPWLISLLGVSIGLPFFVLSSSSPLLQRWFTWVRHRHSYDPYFLYAASNLGSLLALAVYPALAEPLLRLREQAHWWSAGYYFLLVLIGSCAFLLWRSRDGIISQESGLKSSREGDVFFESSFRPTKVRRLRWLLLAFIPSSLMLSVTTYLTTDIASVPLLWVIPLGIYLLTFILAFARRPVLSHSLMLRLMPLLVLPLTVALASRGSDPIFISISLHLAAFFVISIACHGELAQDRPAVAYLTEFYLYMSAGGFLGGLFNTLIAPVLFNSVAEYPVALVIACALISPGESGKGGWRSRVLDFVLPLSLTVVTLFLVLNVQRMDLKSVPLMYALMFGIPAIISYSFSRRRLRFALSVAGILWSANFYAGVQGRILYAERSFFGVSRVTIDEKEQFHEYRNGTTLHGSQRLDSAHRRDATSYYYKTGPLGKFFDAFDGAGELQRVAIIGLGTGAIAGYARPGQRWTYYEIDPAVLRIAREPRYFTYLRDCPATVEVTLGDGRLKLADAADGSYDALILDAYSSDSVPVHLLDRQAMQLYLKKTTPHGKLIFHISNRYLDLEPVIGNLAGDAGLSGLAQTDTAMGTDDIENGKQPSCYVVIGREKADLVPLTQDPRWLPIRTQSRLGVWTDDFSSIISIMRW